MFFKLIADTFSVARDSEHFIQLKTLKKPSHQDQVWLAIEIVGDSKYARATAQSIIDTVEDVFFESPELSAYERLELSLKEVNLIVGNLREKRKKAFGKVNAIISVFSGQELHLTQSGDAEAYLIRNNKFSTVSEGLSSKSADLFVNIASGEINSDDKLIFSTGRLLRLATHSQITQFFNDGVAEAIESIRELAMSDEELSTGVICIHTRLVQKTETGTKSVSQLKWLLKLKETFNKAKNMVQEKIGKKTLARLGSDKVKKTNKKNVLIAIVVILVVLVTSVSVMMDSRRNKAIREEYRTRIEKINQNISTANTRGYANDKETANTILDRADEETREILEANYFRAETLDLLDKIQASRDSINNTDRLRELTPYVDLTTKNPEVKALGLLGLKDNFFVYEYNTLYEVILDQVLAPRLIDESEVIIAATAMEDQNVLVFLTKSGRVMEYAEGQFGFANTDDQTWKSGVDVAAYSKYIYVLSPENNQIYKYARLRDKYSGSTEYNSDADLKDAISLAIDGDIYVLKEEGQITRIYKSKQQPFRIEDLGVDISEATELFTSPELDNLYILDPVNKRVVIVTKSDSGLSRYYGEVVFEDFDNVQGIYVEKNENKMHVLTDKEIYKIDI